MLRISHYESSRGSGWDLSTGLPAHPAQDDEYLGDPMLEGDGVRRCLYCHTTNFRAVLDQVGPEATDHSIGCERCHGPGGHHVAAIDSGLSDLAIVNPGAASADEVNQLCGQCHNIHRPEVLSAPRTDPVWNRFQALALTWSRCYIESLGKLSCTTCHDPHRVAASSSARAEAKCLSCHGPNPQGARAAPATISTDATRLDPLTPSGARVVEGRVREDTSPANTSREKPSPRKERTTCPVNPAKGCLECHMPRAWQQSTHTFKTDHFIRVRDRTPPEG
jgi:hypothetical protein